MHVLVTGGTGQAGRFVVRDLAEAGHRVTVLGRSGEVAWRLGDAVRLPAADALVHAAFDHVPGAYRGGEGGDPAGFWRRNFDGSVRLFGQARDAGVRRCVFFVEPGGLRAAAGRRAGGGGGRRRAGEPLRAAEARDGGGFG